MCSRKTFPSFLFLSPALVWQIPTHSSDLSRKLLLLLLTLDIHFLILSFLRFSSLHFMLYLHNYLCNDLLMSTYTQRLQTPQKNGTPSFCLLLYLSSQHNVEHPVYTQILMREGEGEQRERTTRCSMLKGIHTNRRLYSRVLPFTLYPVAKTSILY